MSVHCAECRLVFCRCPDTLNPVPQEYRPTIFDLVHADLDGRERKGTETYGRPLQAHDGRDSLWDAYEEALDLAMYLRKAIRERDG